jgi:hypothetical protein
VQACYVKLIITRNGEVMIKESTNVNLVKIQSFPILIQRLNEYLKVAEITMVQMFGLVEDKRTFNNLAFVKSKLCNQLTTYLNLFTHNFYTIFNFLYGETIATWKEVYIRY